MAIPHPFEREEGTRDRIALRDHVVLAEIGAFEAERGRPQRLRFDVVVEVEPARGSAEDDVDRILSYDRLAEAVAAELAGGRVDLLETLAERVAARILAEPMAARALVRVEKLDRGPGALGVEILREAERDAPAGAPAGAPRPILAHLGPDAIAARDLSSLLDTLAARGPLVLCVGLPDAPRPRAATPDAQRRIDLLAIEQAAWVLAARDPRLTVASSRTELDWALRARRAVVWAPSRIALSVPGAPDPSRPTALTGWLGELLGAERLVIVGDAPRPETDLPVELIAIRDGLVATADGP